MKKYLAILIMALLTACAQIGVTQPTTFNGKVAAATMAVQTVADAAIAGFQSGKLSKSDAQNVYTTAKTALASIDVAEQMHETNPKAGDDKLTATLAILTALQSYVATQGAK